MSVWKTAPLVVGHRGGRGEGWPPENTIDAFEQARSQGARAIELDVRACADGEAVVFHDRDLTRMTNGRDRRRIDELSLVVLRSIPLDGGATVPTLAEALAWARGGEMAVNVELKYDGPSRATLARATARAVAASGGDVLFSSFDPILLAAIAALAPRFPRALLTHAGQAAWADALGTVLRPPLAAALHLDKDQADARSIERLKRHGLRVGVWTVNDPLQASELVRQGVASIITDAPGRVLDVIGRT